MYELVKNAMFGVRQFKADPLKKGHSKILIHISEREPPALALVGRGQYIDESQNKQISCDSAKGVCMALLFLYHTCTQECHAHFRRYSRNLPTFSPARWKAPPRKAGS
jgi:hypothetical protein